MSSPRHTRGFHLISDAAVTDVDSGLGLLLSCSQLYSCTVEYNENEPKIHAVTLQKVLDSRHA